MRFLRWVPTLLLTVVACGCGGPDRIPLETDQEQIDGWQSQLEADRFNYEQSIEGLESSDLSPDQKKIYREQITKEYEVNVARAKAEIEALQKGEPTQDPSRKQ